MKQSLQLKLGQNLALTPQLQQAIKLLQLSTLDLQQAIDEALEANPLLEREEDSTESQLELTDESGGLDFAEDQVDTGEAQEELEVDTRWDDAPPALSSGAQADPDDGWMDRDAAPESLRDQLYWQLNLTRFSETDHKIAEAFIDSVDQNGRLTLSPEEILSRPF